MKKPAENSSEENKALAIKNTTLENGHLGSSNAFEETENPLSRDADNISDEKLDELLGED